MKAVGASGAENQAIFLEASVIGLWGSSLGVVLGWLVTTGELDRQHLGCPSRRSRGDHFYLPIWLIAGALLSLAGQPAGGWYPPHAPANQSGGGAASRLNAGLCERPFNHARVHSPKLFPLVA